MPTNIHLSGILASGKMRKLHAAFSVLKQEITSRNSFSRAFIKMSNNSYPVLINKIRWQKERGRWMAVLRYVQQRKFSPQFSPFQKPGRLIKHQSILIRKAKWSKKPLTASYKKRGRCKQVEREISFSKWCRCWNDLLTIYEKWLSRT